MKERVLKKITGIVFSAEIKRKVPPLNKNILSQFIPKAIYTCEYGFWGTEKSGQEYKEYKVIENLGEKQHPEKDTGLEKYVAPFHQSMNPHDVYTITVDEKNIIEEIQEEKF